MGGRGKKRTTMAKLNRETRLMEKRIAKDMRKEQRKLEGPEDEVVEAPSDELSPADLLGMERARLRGDAHLI